MEELKDNGVLEFVEKYSNLDRLYRVVEIRYSEGNGKKDASDFSQLDLFGEAA